MNNCRCRLTAAQGFDMVQCRFFNGPTLQTPTPSKASGRVRPRLERSHSASSSMPIFLWGGGIAKRGDDLPPLEPSRMDLRIAQRSRRMGRKRHTSEQISGRLQSMSPDRRGAKATPDPEVVTKPRRRRFTAKYRLRIVEEAERCAGTGEVGQLLRREGLYSSYLANWRKARDVGALRELRSKKRGVKPKARSSVGTQR
jgi:transposase-like protein